MSEENNDGTKGTKMKEKLTGLRSSIEGFIADVNVDDLKKSFSSMMKDAQKDFGSLVERDLHHMRKVLQEEKADFEKKARRFMDQNKKELDTLQSKLDKLVQNARKATARTSAATSTKKKATKKAPATKKSVTTKKAPMKKATKKASKK